MRSMLANRLSYHLKLNGVSCTVDSACSSSLYALEHAYKAIRTGKCNMAIVGAGGICLHPVVSLQFSHLKVLSMQGPCNPFDESADGFVRSETCVALLLQKAKNCKRNYSQIVHINSNVDGFKEQGITFPSKDMQTVLLKEFYQECDIDVNRIDFLDAHGTATRVGDPQELAALDEGICKGRRQPLIVGSTKSNMGHSEGGSGLASISKIIVGMEKAMILPNLHFKNPRQDIEPLNEGRIQVINEIIPIKNEDFLAAINNFGFGGANSHCLLRWNKKGKINQGFPLDSLPRLVCISGREENSVRTILNDLKERQLDAEYISLYHNIFRKNIPNFLYRGYSIVNKSGELMRSIKLSDPNEERLYLVFSSFLNSWSQIIRELILLPLVTESVHRIHDILSPYGVVIMEVLLINNNRSIFEEIMGSMAVQIVLTDLIKVLEIRPDGYCGCGLGELICAYLDDCLSLEQVVSIFYEFAMAFGDYDRKILCSSKKMDKSATNLWYLDIESSNEIRSQLLPKMKKILSGSKDKSKRWLLHSKRDEVSAEYFLESLRNGYIWPLNEIADKNDVIWDIGDGILTQIMTNINTYQNYTTFKPENNEQYFLTILQRLGSLYEFGYTFDLTKLYPAVEYPVSRGTPMISPLIKWNHSHNWYVASYPSILGSSNEYSLTCSIQDEKWSFLTGHVIDERNIFPATGYLNILFEGFSSINNLQNRNTPIVIENCKLLRATNIPKDGNLEFNVRFQDVSGNFEILEGDTAVSVGTMSLLNDSSDGEINLPIFEDLEDSWEMKTEEIYKEFRLRGYNYNGDFKNILSFNSNFTKACVRWNGNWITFLDNMLQLKIIQKDTRQLYIPTSIKRCSIDFKKHLAYIESFAEKEPILPVYYYKNIDVLKCGGIEFHNVCLTPIGQRKPRTPLLEYFDFIPNQAELSLQNSIRVNMQLIVENVNIFTLKCVELCKDEMGDNSDFLSPMIYEALNDYPEIIPRITILTKDQINIPEFKIVNKSTLSDETNCDLITLRNISATPEILQEALGALKETGFILSREPLDFQKESFSINQIQCLAEFKFGKEKMVLLHRKVEPELPKFIKVSNEEFDWVSKLQEAMKNDEHTIIFTENEPYSGILGLINSIRCEPNGEKIKCLFIQDTSAPPFDPNNIFYSEQLKKNLAINVYRNSKWGTYRHLLLNEPENVIREHVYISGDLTNLKLVEGPLNSRSILPPEQELIHVYYSSLNFKDIMVASRRLNVDSVSTDRLQQECLLGFEFSGRNSEGKRFMGIISNGALATLTKADKYFLWEVPNHWSLEEAATVPVIYVTVLCSFFLAHKLKRHESVLIHSGAGGIGQAAIQIALHHGCTVYTTVGTKEKREFLKRRFPQLTDKHIGNSRDTSFEQMIYDQTKGRGVDLVLNSLAEEKLLASVRCLANGGRFLEIGKFDFSNNNPLKLLLLEKSIAFHGIMIDEYFNAEPRQKWEVHNLLKEFLDKGYVKPINTNLFNIDQVEQAFKYMTTGKHIGKVLIKIRDEEPERKICPNILLKKAKPQYLCDPKSNYIIVGGLGGFGLELVDWLVLRGARNLVFSSRRGLSNGYQAYRINLWKSYGCNIKISTVDVMTKEGCKQLIEEANKFAPVTAIFNLATLLKDALFENQTVENFVSVFETKALSAKYLDEVSRERCPNLKSFVVFSSTFAGFGNASQTNYAMGNSVMERICEKRKEDGLPATAIEWGAIADVGLYAEICKGNMDSVVRGRLQQKMINCMETLDMFLNHKHTIPSSIILADKISETKAKKDIAETVAKIIGIRDLKTISYYSSLVELGMDSLNSIEIKQALEREFEIFLTATELRKVTFAKLIDMQEGKCPTEPASENKTKSVELFLKLTDNEEASKLPTVEYKTQITSNSNTSPVIFLPGTEGSAKVLEPLTKNLHVRAIALQFIFDNCEKTLNELALNLLPNVKKHLSKTKPLQIVAYSFGTVLATEIVSLLEKDGYCPGHLVCIDGSFKMITQFMGKLFNIHDEQNFQLFLLSYFMEYFVTPEYISSKKPEIENAKTWEERLDIAINSLPENLQSNFNFYRKCIIGMYKRVGFLKTYEAKFPKLKTKITLFKPDKMMVKDIKEDYFLSEICENPIDIRVFKGNHMTILENMEMAKAVDGFFMEDEILSKDITKFETLVTNVKDVAKGM